MVALCESHILQWQKNKHLLAPKIDGTVNAKRHEHRFSRNNINNSNDSSRIVYQSPN